MLATLFIYTLNCSPCTASELTISRPADLRRARLELDGPGGSRSLRPVCNATDCGVNAIVDALHALKPGDYRSVWIVDGVRSNVVDFTIVAADPKTLPPVVIEEIDGRTLALYIGNTGAKSFEIPEQFFGAKLIVDGKPLTHQGPMLWGGFSSLGPGESFMGRIRLDDYRVPRGWRRIVAVLPNGARSAQLVRQPAASAASPSRRPRR